MTEDDLSPVAGVALWGPLLDRLNVIDVADESVLRQVAPDGYPGGECYRALVETLLAGGDFLSDVELLRDEATGRLRGAHVLPSRDTLWRFCDQADLGRVSKAAAVTRVMLARAWEAGAAPGILTIDPDVTKVTTYGRSKHGSTFSYNYTGTCLHPIFGVFAETGEVCAICSRGGNANPGRALGSFVDECVAAVPEHRRDDYRLWVRIDSAGYAEQVVETCVRHQAWFSITAKKNTKILGAIERLATDPALKWKRATGHEKWLGSQIAETEFSFAGVRPAAAGHLSMPEHAKQGHLTAVRRAHRRHDGCTTPTTTVSHPPGPTNGPSTIFNQRHHDPSRTAMAPGDLSPDPTAKSGSEGVSWTHLACGGRLRSDS